MYNTCARQACSQIYCIYIHMFVCVRYIYTYTICIYIYVYIYIYIYIYIYECANIYIHTRYVYVVCLAGFLSRTFPD